MPFWNALHFAGLAISFVGSLFLALSSSGFEVKNGKVLFRTKLAKAALWAFATGFVLIIC